MKVGHPNETCISDEDTNQTKKPMTKKSTYATQKKFYDAQWAEFAQQKDLGAKCRIDFILRATRQARSKLGHQPRIIDLGCGSGWITNALSELGDIVGVDLSIDRASKSFPQLKFIQSDVILDDIEGKFDIVISSEVIEHLFLKDQAVYVKKAFDLLGRRGILILTTPNRPKTEELFRELPRRYCLQPIENWLDPESLTTLLEPHFKTEYRGSTMFYPITIRKNKYTDFLYGAIYERLKFIDRSLRRSMKGLYLTVVAQKR